jgi:AraC family transcriptional regulator
MTLQSLAHRLDVATNEVVRFQPTRVLLTNRDSWKGFGLEVWESRGEELPETVLLQDSLAIAEGIRTSEVRWSGQKPISGSRAAGTVAVLPMGLPYSARAWARSRSIVVGFQRELFGRSTGIAIASDFELRPGYGLADDLIRSSCYALARDSEDGHPLGPLYGESIINALAAHLVRDHSNHRLRSTSLPDSGGFRLERIRQLIHDSLAEKLTLLQMASHVEMDTHSFSRWFRKSFGAPPYRYVLQARIERAKALLAGTHVPVVDVALQCGFASQSHLSTAFQRLVGASPRLYRQSYGRQRALRDS